MLSDTGTAVGANALIDAGVQTATAIGAGAHVMAGADNSVAIGANSVATDPNTVSFGSPGNERRLTNVADGLSATDAATVGQVNAAEASAVTQANAYTDTRANALQNQINANQWKVNGHFSAMAAMTDIPQAVTAGSGLIGVGVGSTGGQAGIAIGGSKIFSGGHIIAKGSFGMSTRGGYTTVGAGLGWQF